MGLLASKLWQPGTVTCLGLAGASSQHSCPFDSHSPVSGTPRAVGMCLPLESSEVQPHPSGLSGVWATTGTCKGLSTSRGLISVLFYCQAMWVLAWVSFRKLKRTKSNCIYHWTRNAHTNILSSTYTNAQVWSCSSYVIIIIIRQGLWLVFL